MIIVRALYTILLFIASVIAAPLWLWTMKKRGGWGTGLIERLGITNDDELLAYQGADYYHAVSVGEVTMAIKVINECLKRDPSYRAVIAATTATGHQIARTKKPINTHLIYAPLDFPFILNKVFSLLSPRQLILVDSELWVNLQRYAVTHDIPVRVINGRLSERSYKRYLKFRPLIKPMLAPITSVCTDGEVQVSRWANLGVPDYKIYDVGSLKFDLSALPSSPPLEFKDMIHSLGESRPTLMLASTHPGEEKLLAESLKGVTVPYNLVIVPRHAERREEVKKALQSIGYNVLLRSKFNTSPTKQSTPSALLVDSTGELSNWLQLADLVIIGKSWLKKGGQNPFESAILGVPTICGPFMANFEPLFSELVEKHGALQVSKESHLASTVTSLLKDSSYASQIGKKGQSLLESKTGATEKTTTIILNA